MPMPAEDISKLLGGIEKSKAETEPALSCLADKENISANSDNGRVSCRDSAKGSKNAGTRAETTSVDENQSEASSHHPQMIDEDVETFTQKLDTLILTFRTGSLKEFMKIKRNVLTEQSNKIDSEKNRCSALLSAKQDELEKLKDELVVATAQSKRATTQVDRLAAYLKKYNRHGQIRLFKMFSGWRDVVRGRERRQRLLDMRLGWRKSMRKFQAFCAWKKDYTMYRKKKNKEMEEQRVKVRLDETRWGRTRLGRCRSSTQRTSTH